MALLLTGATGFVGMEVLARFLERTDESVYALVRAPDARRASERLRETLATLYDEPDRYAERAIAVPGDIEAEGLGLAARERERLAERVTDVIHCAASVAFDLSLEESRDINVAGTQRLLDFAQLCAERGGLRRFAYVSTAYVAGTHSGRFHEDELDVGQGFRNAYERSKFEAEQLVRSYCDLLPIQIFRPSIVVGERATGWTAAFNVLYAPLKAFARGAYAALPARRSAPVDVVPVDYVADAVFELFRRPMEDEEPGTFHLVAGPRATTVGRLIDASADYFSRGRPRALTPALYRHLVHPLLKRRSHGKRRRALERSELYFPYFSMRVRYDDRRARRLLDPAGIRPAPLERYFSRLADFAVRSDWGRRAVSRAAAARGTRRTPAGRAR